MNKIAPTLIFFLFVTSLLSEEINKNKQWIVSSPDRKIEVKIYQQKNKQKIDELFYEVFSVKGKQTNTIIERSPLGIVRKDQQFAQNLTFISSSKLNVIDEKYDMLIGRQTAFRNHANEMEFTFQNPKGALLKIVFRAYNDGIAFKYVFPEESKKTYTVKKELTGFKFAVGGKAWIQPYDKPSQ